MTHSRKPFSRGFHLALIFTLVFGVISVLPTQLAQAQTRVNDKDMQALMENLRHDTKAFRSEFDSAVKKSAIRDTRQEKDARNLVKNFDRQTETMLKRFKKDRGGEDVFQNVQANAEQIHENIQSLALGDKINARWDKIRAELDHIGAAYGVPVTLKEELAPSRPGA